MLQEKWLRATEKTVRLLKNIEPTISLETEIPSETYSYQALTGPPFEPILLQDLLVNVHENSYAYDKLIMLKELRLVLNNYLSAYSERDQVMIDLRFGLTDGDERTLEEIGQEFGVTRERVRQITAKALERLARRKKTLEQYSTLSNTLFGEPLLSKQVSEFLVEEYSYWTKYHNPDKENDTNEYWQWLDELIDKLPGSDWHQRSSTSSRRTQVEDALQILGTPAHYTDIAEQLNDMIGDDLDDSYVYTMLNKYEDTFVLLGEGVFSLVEWESARRKEPLPLLPFCPSPLPDLPGQTDTFFESVLVARNYLKKPMRASRFLEEMLAWSHNDVEQSNWCRQSILNSYYVVGLIPYTFHFNGADPLLEDAGPISDDLQFLRRYCLTQLTERLATMPQFWWVLRRYQPGRITDFAEPFVDIHPLGLDDVANRLKLLAGLGAVRRLSYGKYQLSSLGEEMATQLMQQPVLDEVSDETEAENEVEKFKQLELML